MFLFSPAIGGRGRKIIDAFKIDLSDATVSQHFLSIEGFAASQRDFAVKFTSGLGSDYVIGSDRRPHSPDLVEDVGCIVL